MARPASVLGCPHENSQKSPNVPGAHVTTSQHRRNPPGAWQSPRVTQSRVWRTGSSVNLLRDLGERGPTPATLQNTVGSASHAPSVSRAASSELRRWQPSCRSFLGSTSLTLPLRRSIEGPFGGLRTLGACGSSPLVPVCWDVLHDRHTCSSDNKPYYRPCSTGSILRLQRRFRQIMTV